MQKANKLIILLVLLLAVFQIPAYSQFLSTCTDSDGGNNINQAGTLTLSSIFRTVTKRDFCSSGQLIEYFCRDNKIGFEIKTCPSQTNCYQGACVGSTGQPTQPPQPPAQPPNPPEAPQNPPAIPQQPIANNQNPLNFDILNVDNVVPTNQGSIVLEGSDAYIAKRLAMPGLREYKYNVLDYDKDGFIDVSINNVRAQIEDELFYIFKGVSNTKAVKQDLKQLGIDFISHSQFHYWKDVDNDGYQDLILHKSIAGGGWNHYASLYWNNKDGTFTVYDAPGNGKNFAGVVRNQRGTLTIQPPAPYPLGQYLVRDVQFEDINGDNLLDIVYGIDVYFNDGNRGFTAGKAIGLPQVFPTNAYQNYIDKICYCVAKSSPSESVEYVVFRTGISDLDLDGDKDMVYYKNGRYQSGKLDGDSGIFVALNDGRGNFKTQKIMPLQPTSDTPYPVTLRLELSDHELDGDVDIIILIKNYPSTALLNKVIP